MGAIMKDFAREQEERDEESRPKMLSPIPQKVRESLRKGASSDGHSLLTNDICHGPSLS